MARKKEKTVSENEVVEETIAEGATASEALENLEASAQDGAADGGKPAVETATTDGEKKPRRAPPPRDPKYADTTIITLLQDDKGVEYGPENNPKKVGSAAHQRFALYKSGMTVKEAKELGLNSGDFDYDSKKKFISLS